MILAADTGEVGTMGAALLDAGIKSAGVLLMAAVAAGCMRRQSAGARHMVWFLSVLGLLALPVLSWTLPGWNVLPQWTNPRPVVAATSAPAQQPTPVQQPLPVARQATDTSMQAERPKIVNSTEVSLANNPSASAPVVQPPPVVAKTLPPTPATRRMAWKALLLPLWLAGTLVAVSPTLLGLLSLWNLERRSRRERAPAWTELLRHLMTRVGLARPVELLKTGSRRMPMTWGVVRPKLLLPEEAEEWTEERRRVVMLHELAHAKRWDYLSNLLTQIVCAVYWFNPLVWIAARQMVKERERACDDIVLNNGSKPADYAEQVLQIAAGLPSAGSLAVYSGIAMARQSSLEERLRAILDKGRNRKALTRIAVLVMVAVFALVVGPLAMLRPVASKAAAIPQVKEVRIISIGRPDNSRKAWWDTNGVAVNLGPVFDGRTPNAAFVVAIDRDGVQGRVDCSIVTANKKIDLAGSGIKGDMADGISTTICYLIETPDNQVRAYLDGGGQVDFVLKHGMGPWTETAVVYPGQTVVTNGGRFGLGKIEAIREATRTGLLWTSRMPGLMLIDGRYDFDSKYEVAWVAVDKQGKRTPIVDSTGGGMFQSNTNRRVFYHVQMGRADLDHFLVLSRPVKETVYRGIPTKVGMKSSIDPAKTKEREAVAKVEWGEAVEGVQTRAAYVGMRSNAPALLADLRNSGTVGVQVSENAFRWRVEVDGVWYRFNTNGAQLLTIVPGETRTNIAVVLDGNWMKAAPSEMNPAMFGGGGGGGIPRNFARVPLKLSPGKHTVRFGMMTRIVRLGAGAVLAVSKPVEVEVPQGGESAATGNDNSASFGPVMERDVPGFSHGNPRSLDLDTGKLVAGHPPGDMELLGGESDSRVRHALDMVTVGVSSNKWDATAAEVLSAVAGVAPQKQARLGGIESRRTFFFKTQEGAAGVLQVLPDENGAVKVRYKVIQNGPAKSAQAVPGGDDLLRKDRLFAEARGFSADSRDLRDPKDLEGEFSISGVADAVSLKGRPMPVRISYANPWAKTKR